MVGLRAGPAQGAIDRGRCEAAKGAEWGKVRVGQGLAQCVCVCVCHCTYVHVSVRVSGRIVMRGGDLGTAMAVYYTCVWFMHTYGWLQPMVYYTYVWLATATCLCTGMCVHRVCAGIIICLYLHLHTHVGIIICLHLHLHTHIRTCMYLLHRGMAGAQWEHVALLRGRRVLLSGQRRV